MNQMSSDASLDETFIAQCEADYNIAEITTVAHVAAGASLPTHLLAVVELLHKDLEPNPLVSLAPDSGGYPRRADLGARAGKLLVQRWHISVREGIQWYRVCETGSMAVPSMNPSKPAVIKLGQLGDDPPWPYLAVEVEGFWRNSEFWGRRPGGSRWHRLLPVSPVNITNGWEASDFEKARDFLMSQIHIDLLSRSVLLGSCHLRLPNPVFRDLHQSVGSDWRTITFNLRPHSIQFVDEVELTFWNQRSWGATSVRHMILQPGTNVLQVPEGVELVSYAVSCPKRGLIMQSESAGFISTVRMSMHVASEQRHVETPKGGYSVDVGGNPEQIEVGNPRPVGALARLAADEGQQRKQKAWAATAFRWFDKDRVAGTQAIRDIIQSASKSVDLLDPYFGRCDLMEFALSTTKHGLPFRILTSHDYCISGEDPDLKIEYGDALAETLDSVRAQDLRLDIEVKVMPGQKSPVHDRFLIVDGAVWVLGASLNEFGSRGSLLMKLPESPDHGLGSPSGFSVSTSIFDAYWGGSHSLDDWVKRREASRTGSSSFNKPVKLKDRVQLTKRVLVEAFRRVSEVWCA